jgi:hypothetical protein
MLQASRRGGAAGRRPGPGPRASSLERPGPLNTRRPVRYTAPVSVDLIEIEEFGRIDAESEEQLEEFFLRTDAYQRIEDQELLVVVGRKGTGKTAIYKILLERIAHYDNTFGTGLQFIPVPTIQEQQEISRRVKQLLPLAGRVDAKIALADTRAERMQHAILVKAFRGDLAIASSNGDRGDG